MSDTTIEWTQKSWNPIVGCSIKSAGCANCYAMPMAARLAAMGVDHYQGLTKKVNGNAVWTGKLAVNENALLEPLRRKKPTTYFVNSMGDLFHEDCPDEWIDRVFAVMALCPRHTFQILTKRSDRMREYFRRQNDNGHHPAMDLAAIQACTGQFATPALHLVDDWPLKNVWLGVSVEDQRAADERIPDLLATPAAIRWLSCEPLLGPVDLTRVVRGDWGGERESWNALCGFWQVQDGDHFRCGQTEKLDWIVVGGESGKDARPMHPDWARSLRDQCAAAGVPFFFKQWGNWSSDMDICARSPNAKTAFLREPSKLFLTAVGKKKAGRLLDGVQHDATPSSPNRGGGPAQPVEGQANIDRSPFPQGREKGAAR